jgi:hypothetical protein
MRPLGTALLWEKEDTEHPHRLKHLTYQNGAKAKVHQIMRLGKVMLLRVMRNAAMLCA